MQATRSHSNWGFSLPWPRQELLWIWEGMHIPSEMDIRNTGYLIHSAVLVFLEHRIKTNVSMTRAAAQLDQTATIQTSAAERTVLIRSEVLYVQNSIYQELFMCSNRDLYVSRHVPTNAHFLDKPATVKVKTLAVRFGLFWKSREIDVTKWSFLMWLICDVGQGLIS